MDMNSAGKYLMITMFMCHYSCANISYPNSKEVEGPKPLWSTRLPGQAGIYNDGLIGLPVYKDIIFFHSTVFTGLKGEDNRIHALDLQTGKIEWTFPSVYDPDNPMCFSGKPYMFENHMVIKMPAFGSFCNFDRIICINLDNGSCEWKIEIPTMFSEPSCRDVGGYDNKFFFVSESKKETFIFKGDVLTGDTCKMLTFSPSNKNDKHELNTASFYTIGDTNQSLMLYSTKEYSHLTYQDSKESVVCLLDLKTGNKISEINVVDDDRYNITDAVLYQDKIYCVSGRKVYCLNPKTASSEWSCQTTEMYNFVTTDIVVDKDVLFLWGVNRYHGLDMKTGETIYDHEISCGNAAVFKGMVYMVSWDGLLYVIDILTGEKMQKISSPENHFLTGCKPHVFEGKLYVFDYFNAYCYGTEF